MFRLTLVALLLLALLMPAAGCGRPKVEMPKDGGVPAPKGNPGQSGPAGAKSERVDPIKP